MSKGFDYYKALNDCIGAPYTTKIIVTPDNNENKIMSPSCIIGAQLPEVNVKTINGQSINSDYFKSKPTVINFWFEGCPPCIAEIPAFNNIAEKYKDKINFLAISRDSDKDVKNYLSRHKFTADHVGNGQELIMNTFKSRWGFPTTFVVDTNLKIVDGIMGAQPNEKAIPTLEAFLESAIKNLN